MELQCKLRAAGQYFFNNLLKLLVIDIRVLAIVGREHDNNQPLVRATAIEVYIDQIFCNSAPGTFVEVGVLDELEIILRVLLNLGGVLHALGLGEN